MFKRSMLALLVLLMGATLVRAESEPRVAPPKVTNLRIAGAIDGGNITFILSFEVETFAAKQEVELAAGELVLDELVTPKEGVTLRYDRDARKYVAVCAGKGTYSVRVKLAAKPQIIEPGAWREAGFSVPDSWVRQLEVTCDRQDLEVEFPAAMRLLRETKDGKLTITAVMGAGKPFAVRWKPLLPELSGKLVFTATGNAIATVRGGALTLDMLWMLDIAQGKLDEITFTVPKDLSITQVKGPFIRDWRLEPAPGTSTAVTPTTKPASSGPDTTASGPRRLVVSLNRPQTARYALQLTAETTLAKFPVEADLPMLIPDGALRTSGQLAVGTDSAIQILIKSATGLTQIEPTAFARILMDPKTPRPLPQGKAFFYTHAGASYALKLGLDDIVPALEAEHRLVALFKEEDLTLTAGVELDVRDAPIRQASLLVPGDMLVAAVEGSDVDNFLVRAIQAQANQPAAQEIEVRFKKPVLGRSLLSLRLEMGKGPLGRVQTLRALTVRNARAERGYLAVAVEEGVQLGTPTATNLREVHIASIPMRVPNAQFVYRFRAADWTLAVRADKRASDVRAEIFELISLGEGAAYGSAAVSYFISGSPVDEFVFRIDKLAQNVEFVGRDVRRWTQDPNDPTRWTVKLQRKVIGDYNLGVTFTQRFVPTPAPAGDKPASSGPDKTSAASQFIAGAVSVEGATTQTGYLAVAGQQTLRLAVVATPGKGLLEIERDEIPANYRLLLNAPALKTYKYVDGAHAVTLQASAYERRELLAVVIELMDIQSQVTPAPGGSESVTTVRYKIKNASDQFLTLNVPAGATVWQARQLSADGSSRRLASSFDKQRNLLLIPLERNRNPNEPLSIEVQYGLKHTGSQTDLALAAPASGTQSTFIRWTVQAPGDYALFPEASAGALLPEPRDFIPGGLRQLLQQIARSWIVALMIMVRPVTLLVAGPIVAGLILLIALTAFRSLPGALMVILLLLLTILGAGAGLTILEDYQLDRRAMLNSLTYQSAVNIDSSKALQVRANLVPAWRQEVTTSGAVVAPIVAGAALLGTLLLRRWRFVRPLGAAVVLTALTYAAAQFPACRPWIAQALTWGLPLVLALVALVITIRRARRDRVVPPLASSPMPAPGAAMLLLAVGLLSLFTLSGCAGGGVIVPPPPAAQDIVIQKLQCDIHAEKDSTHLTYTLTLESDKPVKIPLIDSSAVLLSPEPEDKDLGVLSEQGSMWVQLKKKGTYQLKLEFLRPLPEAGEDQVRRLTLGLPPALTNRVNLTIAQVNLNVQAPSAVRLTTSEGKDQTQAQAIFGVGQAAAFTWRPQARRVQLEKTVAYADIVTAARFDAGIIEARHRVRYQIAQGVLKDIRLTVPANMTVTAVEGADLGTWRFDPATHQLEAVLVKDAVGEYALTVVTQLTAGKPPFDTTIGTLQAAGVVRQLSTLGLLTTPAVAVSVGAAPQAMNLDDFARDVGAWWAYPAATAVRYAFRLGQARDVVAVKVDEVTSEIQVEENAVFTVADDRLVYNGQLAVNIAKAGQFGFELRLPEGYDIDALTAPEVSHWDDVTEAGVRKVQVHLNRKLLGTTQLRLALSKTVAELPRKIEVPRVAVADSVKHTGQIKIVADRGVRLAVAQREGVSEFNPVELGIREPGTLAFRLVRPTWQLTLETEVVEPRITVDFVHVARISEGVVQHTHHLRYALFNAGAKVFEVAAPAGALGVQITGPDVARVDPTGTAGRYRVELSGKWYDRPYPLTVRYEMPYDRAAGRIELAPVRAVGVDLQRGYVVVRGGERVELSVGGASSALQPADARALPRDLGVGQVAGVFCYATPNADYALTLGARRHESAALLEATVNQVRLQTVVAEDGSSVTRAVLELRVLSKRYLFTHLPQGSTVWSLLVNGRSTTPSKLTDAQGRELTLIPLAQSAAGELPVQVDLIYVTAPGNAPAPGSGSAHSGPRMDYPGPSFDLPLKDVAWTLYLPENRTYDNFGGTLMVNQESNPAQTIVRYDAQQYEELVANERETNKRRALEYQALGQKLAQEGKPTAAKVALGNAFNYSFAAPGLNEDARVQLQDMNRAQAKAGLINSRDRLRAQRSFGGQTALDEEQDNKAERLSQADVQRINAGLSKPDSENVDQITDRLLATQEAAAGNAPQLVVTMPLNGRVVEFERAVMVESYAPLSVSMTGKPAQAPDRTGQGAALLGLGAGLLVLLALLRVAACRLPAIAKPVPTQSDPAVTNTPPTPEVP